MKSQSDIPPAPEHKAYITGDCEISAFGLGARERLTKELQRLGITVTDNIENAHIVLSDHCLFGPSVLRALTGAPSGTLLVDNERYLAAARLHRTTAADENIRLLAMLDKPAPTNHRMIKTGSELAGRYDELLRKRTDPTVLRARSRSEIEKSLFAASYKGVTDFVTKHVWPAPALIVTRWCALNKITPNQVTALSAVFVVIAFWLFWTGDFALGMVFAWLMTFLDTVDGKLARVTLTSSPLGNVFDHSIDLIHPPFWWWAWAVGCAAYGTPLDDGGWVLGAIVAGYILQRVEEGIFIQFFGMHMHVWRRFDSYFRQITARRNPNLVILTLALFAGHPREGLILVALWTLICLFIHFLQIVQAAIALRHGPLTSWLAKE